MIKTIVELDHYHFTGQYRGAAHSVIHLKYSRLKRISVIVHNIPNYGDHLFKKELAKESEGESDFLGENTKIQKKIQFQ